MKVKFSFDKTALTQRDYTLEDVHWTIKRLFTARGLPFASDGDTLTFHGRDHGDDFAVMWDIILSLLRSDWFMDCAASCV